MRIAHISDTHGSYEQLSGWLEVLEADLIVHSGDFTAQSRNFAEISSFLNWFSELPIQHKIIVPGNHDWVFEIYDDGSKLHIPKNIHLLIDESIVIDGIKFFGSPCTPAFNNWAFQLYEEFDNEFWRIIPDDTDVLITHGPAYGTLDTTGLKDGLGHLGCKWLRDRIQQLQIKAHLFGHIHGGYGRKKLKHYEALNSSIMTETYRPLNMPQVIEVNL